MEDVTKVVEFRACVCVNELSNNRVGYEVYTFDWLRLKKIMHQDLNVLHR